MNVRETRSRILAFSLGLLLLASVGFVASGCGSSSGASGGAATAAAATAETGTTAPGDTDFAAFRECLQEHGVEDPGAGQGPPGGFNGDPPPDGANPSPPAGANTEAFEACRELMPAGDGFGGENGGQELQAYRDCLEEQGVDMSSRDRESEEFQQAAAACRDELPAGGMRPGGTPSGGMPGQNDGGNPQFEAYQECLREQGIDPDNPGDQADLRKAIDACRGSLPNGGGGNGTP